MELTYADEKQIKSLEDYAVFLVTGMLSLKTLYNQQVRALEIGILPDDLAEKSNIVLYDIRRMINLYQQQTEEVLQLVPDDFNINTIVSNLKARELTLARSITRKKKEKPQCAM